MYTSSVFCCSMELFSSGLERLVFMGCWLLGYISQLSWCLNIKGHCAMQFCGAIRCVDHIFEATGLYLACICVFVTLNGHWAAVFILTYSYLFIIFIGLQGGHAFALKVGVLRSPELRRLAELVFALACHSSEDSFDDRAIFKSFPEI